ncbi:DUF2493 domain-containing protein [Mangrovimonas cancribranchiae]|uniref:DUF2493 domain-containing protein n=1 Tax=Mangrovimonas cancribranchiae TaxID=3080055 RepID=A0AAU6PA60_9FLAO
MRLRVLIAGSRTYANYENLKRVCDLQLRQLDEVEIISGGARGADRLAIRYAEENQLKLTIVKPDWKTFGKAAGFVRNAAMIEFADLVIVFWDGKSTGTKHAIALARLRKIKVIINFFKEDA